VERAGRNPRRGEVLKIPEKKVVRFGWMIVKLKEVKRI